MKQWYSKIGHNSGVVVTEHLGQKVYNRPYGTFPDGYVTPAIETPHLLETMRGVGPDRFCAALNGYVEGKISFDEMNARISAFS